MLTQEQLHALLWYCPVSGHFQWRHPRTDLTAKPAGYINDKGYRVIKIQRVRYFAHRLAWFYMHGMWPEVIDHINCQPGDNRIDNLRAASRTENARNRKTHANSALGLKGVHLTPEGRYKADIWLGRRHILLGFFETAAAAAEARKAATLRLHGEFANIVSA